MAFDTDLSSIADDLQFLRDEWAPGVDDRTIRHGSAVLRRFLVDGGQGILLTVWRQLGLPKQPFIVAPDLLAIAGGTFEGVELALSGGGDPGGALIGGMVMVQGSTPREPKVEPGANPMERLWTLSDFVSAPAAAVSGQAISRRELVKFYANYLGGVHLHLSNKVRKQEEALVRRLKQLRNRIEVHRKDGLLFELLSIGQALGASEDLQALGKSIREAS